MNLINQQKFIGISVKKTKSLNYEAFFVDFRYFQIRKGVKKEGVIMPKKINIFNKISESIRNNFSEIKTKTRYDEYGNKVIETFNENTGEQITKLLNSNGVDYKTTTTNYIGAEYVIVETKEHFYLQNITKFEKTIYMRFGENEMAPIRTEISDARLKSPKTLILYEYDKNNELISKETIKLGFVKENKIERVFIETQLESNGKTEIDRNIYLKNDKVTNFEIYNFFKKFETDLNKKVEIKDLNVEHINVKYENSMKIETKYNKNNELICKTEFLSKNEVKETLFNDGKKTHENYFINNIIEKRIIFDDKKTEIFFSNGTSILELTRNNFGNVESYSKDGELHTLEYNKNYIIDKVQLYNGNLEVRNYPSDNLDKNGLPKGKYTFETFDEKGNIVEKGFFKNETDYKISKFDSLGNRVSEIECSLKGKEIISKETFFDKTGNKILELDIKDDKIEFSKNKDSENSFVENIVEKTHENNIENEKYNLDYSYDSSECCVN